MAAISNDPSETTVPFAESKGIEYPLLNDIGSAVIREYGVLNTLLAPDDDLFGLAFPGTLVLDAEGRVVSRFFEEKYQTRMTGKTLDLQLGGEPVPVPDSAMRVSGEQLDLTVYASDPSVAPGQEFMVTVDVNAGPGIHVYAPGEHPYRVIRLVLEPEALFSAKDPIYPESRDYFLEPLDEHTPVFEGSFRILVPVVIQASRELYAQSKEPGASVTLRAKIEYQACDDKVCFVPVSVPVTLTLGLRPFASK